MRVMAKLGMGQNKTKWDDFQKIFHQPPLVAGTGTSRFSWDYPEPVEAFGPSSFSNKHSAVTINAPCVKITIGQ